jgi:hypothetical protein
MNMGEMVTGDPAPEQLLRRTRELRLGLLRLHKTLLDGERTIYERVYGQVNGGELLQLVINHEQFAWLHAFSELIVRIDEMLDDEVPTAEEAEALLAQAQTLLKPAEDGGEFGRKYFAALQRDPDAVLAHGKVMSLLSADI